MKSVKPEIAFGQSTGMLRDHNEDTLYTHSVQFSNGEDDFFFGVFIVADGMGGHENGEIASKIAVSTFIDFVNDRIFKPLINFQTDQIEGNVTDFVKEGLNLAHQCVRRTTQGGGTTFTSCLILERQLVIGHVGDSRVYFIYPDGNFKQLTKDHTLVQILIDKGKLTEEQAYDHPNRNILYQALGQFEILEPEIIKTMITEEGYLLICSDGLSGVVNTQEIISLVNEGNNLSTTCSNLIAAANDAGGPDNISVILIKV